MKFFGVLHYDFTVMPSTSRRLYLSINMKNIYYESLSPQKKYILWIFILTSTLDTVTTIILEPLKKDYYFETNGCNIHYIKIKLFF